jgi:hypothetical protein
VVDVTDGADVDVQLGALELLLRHVSPPSKVTLGGPDACLRTGRARCRVTAGW